LRWYVEHYSARGFPEYFKRIRREGFLWNHKRVRRVYKKLGMNHRRKPKRCVSNPDKQVLLQPLHPNTTWSIDFMEDRLMNGRKFGISHLRIQKGKPMQNGYIERFNRTYREDVLNTNIFENISHVIDLTDKFTEDYNQNHPHHSLNGMTPIEFINKYSKKIPYFVVGF
jgi:putative transposase